MLQFFSACQRTFYRPTSSGVDEIVFHAPFANPNTKKKAFTLIQQSHNVPPESLSTATISASELEELAAILKSILASDSSSFSAASTCPDTLQELNADKSAVPGMKTTMSMRKQLGDVTSSYNTQGVDNPFLYSIPAQKTNVQRRPALLKKPYLQPRAPGNFVRNENRKRSNSCSSPRELIQSRPQLRPYAPDTLTINTTRKRSLS